MCILKKNFFWVQIHLVQIHLVQLSTPFFTFIFQIPTRNLCHRSLNFCSERAGVSAISIHKDGFCKKRHILLENSNLASKIKFTSFLYEKRFTNVYNIDSRATLSSEFSQKKDSTQQRDKSSPKQQQQQQQHNNTTQHNKKNNTASNN